MRGALPARHRRLRHLAGLAVLLAGALATVVAPAKQLYEYVDERGIRHFTDVPPDTDAPVKATRIRVDPSPLVRLETRGDGGQASTIWVHSRFAGPLEVELALTEVRNALAEPPLPRRVVLAPQASMQVARVRSADPYQDAAWRVEVVAVPGDPRSRPEPAARYRLPLPSGTRYAVGQAFGGRFSHSDEQNFHAVDLGVAEGTPVLAARDGVVVQVERDFFESGQDLARLGDRANMVRVLHEDGTMAVYAHLAFESVLVREGSVVLAGQRLGAAGATGFATGPHLHFVIQRNEGLRLVSIPFAFDGPDGAWTPQAGERWRLAP